MNNFNSNDLLNKIELVENKNNSKSIENLLKIFHNLIQNLEKTNEDTIKYVEKFLYNTEDFLNFQYSKIEKIIEKIDKKILSQKYYEIKNLQKLIYNLRLKNIKKIDIYKKYFKNEINYLNSLEKKLKISSKKIIIFKTEELMKIVKGKVEHLAKTKNLTKNIVKTFKCVEIEKNFPMYYVYFPQIKEINFNYYAKQFDCLTDLWNEIITLINADYYSEEKLNFKIMELCLEKYDEIHTHLINQQK